MSEYIAHCCQVNMPSVNISIPQIRGSRIGFLFFKELSAAVIPTPANAMGPMQARYWKWSAKYEKRNGYALKKPRAGTSVPAKKSKPAKAPRQRRNHITVNNRNTAAGERYCHHTHSLTFQRG